MNLKQAWQYYIINRCSFSGLGEGSGSFSKDASTVLFSHNLISKLPKFSGLMKIGKSLTMIILNCLMRMKTPLFLQIHRMI